MTPPATTPPKVAGKKPVMKQPVVHPATAPNQPSTGTAAKYREQLNRATRAIPQFLLIRHHRLAEVGIVLIASIIAGYAMFAIHFQTSSAPLTPQRPRGEGLVIERVNQVLEWRDAQQRQVESGFDLPSRNIFKTTTE